MQEGRDKMVLVTQNTLGGLGRGIEQAGQSLGSGLQNILQQTAQRRTNQKSGNILERVIKEATVDPNTGESQELTPLSLSQTLNKALSEGASESSVRNFSDIYKNIHGAQKSGIFKNENPEEVKTLLQDLGLDENTADAHARLYSNLSTGGKTSYGNFLIDQLQRGQLGVESPQEEVQEKEEVISKPGEREDFFEEEEIKFPEVNPFGEALTPKEKAKVQSELFKDNTKNSKEASDKLKGLKSEERSIRQLNTINERGKLPKNLNKAINVDLKTGDVKITPSFLNADTQLFVKTINEFVRKARDSFGARVTNFELDKFLQGLPTLANTEEGRRLILEQMDVVNKLNQLENESLRKVYRNYGLRGIDSVQAEEVAEKIRAPQEKKLMQRFDQVVLKNDILKAKRNLPENHSLVRHNGKIKAVKNEDIEKAKKVGAEIL